MALNFVPATKQELKARIALEGISGGGKTYSALAIASGLGERIACIDTEHKRARLYADIFKFDWLGVDRFAPEVLIDALAGASGHDVCIIDSWSHWWMGIDGMLEQVDRAAKRPESGGNNFGGWKEMRPAERRMMDAMMAYPGHLIVTLRTKTQWVVEVNSKGKQAPKKIGMKAEQREGLEYEFDVVGHFDTENTLTITKSRCPLFNGAAINKPGEEFGQTLREWLEAGVNSGPTALELRDEALDKNLMAADLLELYRRADGLGHLGAAVINENGDATTLGDLIKAKGTEARKRETEGAAG